MSVTVDKHCSNSKAHSYNSNCRNHSHSIHNHIHSDLLLGHFYTLPHTHTLFHQPIPIARRFAYPNPLWFVCSSSGDAVRWARHLSRRFECESRVPNRSTAPTMDDELTTALKSGRCGVAALWRWNINNATGACLVFSRFCHSNILDEFLQGKQPAMLLWKLKLPFAITLLQLQGITKLNYAPTNARIPSDFPIYFIHIST